MSDEFSDLDDMLGFLAEEGPDERDRGEHLGPEILAVYVANKLSPEADLRVRSHLAGCKPCRELLLELEEMLVPVTAGTIADAEEAADWRKLRTGMERPESQVPKVRPHRPGFFASVWGGYSVAAVMLVIAVGLGIRNAKLAEELVKPQPASTVQTLEAQGSSRGGTNPAESVILPAEITLLLPTETPDSLYRIDITHDGSVRPDWSFDVPQSKNALSFRLFERSLSPGVYSVQVFALGKGRPTAASWSYTLQIVPSAR